MSTVKMEYFVLLHRKGAGVKSRSRREPWGFMFWSTAFSRRLFAAAVVLLVSLFIVDATAAPTFIEMECEDLSTSTLGGTVAFRDCHFDSRKDVIITVEAGRPLTLLLTRIRWAQGSFVIELPKSGPSNLFVEVIGSVFERMEGSVLEARSTGTSVQNVSLVVRDTNITISSTLHPATAITVLGAFSTIHDAHVFVDNSRVELTCGGDTRAVNCGAAAIMQTISAGTAKSKAFNIAIRVVRAAVIVRDGGPNTVAVAYSRYRPHQGLLHDSRNIVIDAVESHVSCHGTQGVHVAAVAFFSAGFNAQVSVTAVHISVTQTTLSASAGDAFATAGAVLMSAFTDLAKSRASIIAITLMRSTVAVSSHNFGAFAGSVAACGNGNNAEFQLINASITLASSELNATTDGRVAASSSVVIVAHNAVSFDGSNLKISFSESTGFAAAEGEVAACAGLLIHAGGFNSVAAIEDFELELSASRISARANQRTALAVGVASFANNAGEITSRGLRALVARSIVESVSQMQFAAACGVFGYAHGGQFMGTIDDTTLSVSESQLIARSGGEANERGAALAFGLFTSADFLVRMNVMNAFIIGDLGSSISAESSAIASAVGGVLAFSRRGECHGDVRVLVLSYSDCALAAMSPTLAAAGGIVSRGRDVSALQLHNSSILASSATTIAASISGQGTPSADASAAVALGIAVRVMTGRSSLTVGDATLVVVGGASATANALDSTAVAAGVLASSYHEATGQLSQVNIVVADSSRAVAASQQGQIACAAGALFFTQIGVSECTMKGVAFTVVTNSTAAATAGGNRNAVAAGVLNVGSIGSTTRGTNVNFSVVESYVRARSVLPPAIAVGVGGYGDTEWAEDASDFYGLEWRVCGANISSTEVVLDAVVRRHRNSLQTRYQSNTRINAVRTRVQIIDSVATSDQGSSDVGTCLSGLSTSMTTAYPSLMRNVSLFCRPFDTSTPVEDPQALIIRDVVVHSEGWRPQEEEEEEEEKGGDGGDNDNQAAKLAVLPGAGVDLSDADKSNPLICSVEVRIPQVALAPNPPAPTAHNDESQATATPTRHIATATLLPSPTHAVSDSASGSSSTSPSTPNTATRAGTVTEAVAAATHPKTPSLSATALIRSAVPSTDTAPAATELTAATSSAPESTGLPFPSTQPVAPAPNATKPQPARAMRVSVGSAQLTSVMTEDAATAVSTAGSTTAVAAGIANPASASQVARIGGIVRALECAIVDDDLAPSFVEMPLQMDFGGGDLATYAGSLLLTTVSLVVFPFLFHAAWWRWRSHQTSILKGASAVYVVCLEYFGPNAVGAAVLLISIGDGLERLIGLCCIAAILATSGVVARRLLHDGVFGAIYVESDAVAEGERAHQAKLSNKMCFVNKHHNSRFVEAMFAFFDGARTLKLKRVRAYILEELLVSSLIAAVTSIRRGGCSAVAAAMVIVSFAHLLYLLIVKPYRTRLDAGFSLLSAVLQLALGSLVLAVLLRGGGDTTHLDRAIGALLTAIFVEFFVQAVVQVLWLCIIHSRRSRQAHAASPLERCHSDRSKGRVGVQKHVSGEADNGGGGSGSEMLEVPWHTSIDETPEDLHDERVKRPGGFDRHATPANPLIS